MFKAVVKSDTYKKIKWLTKKMQAIGKEEDRVTDLFDSSAIPYEKINIYKDSNGFDDLEKERERLGKRIDKICPYRMMTGIDYSKNPLKLKFD